jgi:hypothetical protein
MSKAEEKREEVEKKVLPYVPLRSLLFIPFSILFIPLSNLSASYIYPCMIAHPRNVFFDIDIAGEKAGRIIFKLYDDIVPKVPPLPPSLYID